VAKIYSLSGGRKASNAILKTLIQLGIPSGPTVLVTVPGRRTGQPRSTPVIWLVEDNRRYLVAPYGVVGWVQNVRAAGGRAQIKHSGRRENVRLQEVPAATAAPLLKQYVAKNRIVVPYFDAEPGDPVERFVSEADKHPVFVIQPG
jgi:deazaflavin-dependent oxidoreductase (nitroreductase family)